MASLLANFETNSLVKLALDRVTTPLVGMGTIAALAVAAGLAFRIVRKVASWRRSMRQFKLARIRLRISGC
jgi:hypothetical protein